MFRSQTPPIRDRQGQVVPGSVALLEKVTLGGLPQQILIRGKNVNNPVLLMLHGGPGSSQIGFARKLFAELEDDFVVVNWDQRGSGMSFPRNLPRETMTIEQFESDTLELINLLRERFHQDRIL
jgi:pimeloyl-ACP methyl ester carboxylesterase